MEENKKVIAVIDMKSFYSYVECVDRGLDPWKTPLVVADVERSINTIIFKIYNTTINIINRSINNTIIFVLYFILCRYSSVGRATHS